MNEREEITAAMAGRLRGYLAGEHAAARWHLGLSLPALAAGGLLLILAGRPFLLGLGWTLLLTGSVQGWTGWQYLREWRRLSGRLPGLFQQDPKAFARQEKARMETLLAYHRRLRTVVLSVLILGITLALTGGVVRPLPFTLGLGMGCCLQGAVLLVLTISSHWRNELYAYEVHSFDEKDAGS